MAAARRTAAASPRGRRRTRRDSRGVVARQVGEPGGGEPHAVQAELGEPVAGCFEGGAVGPRPGQRRQLAVQGDRVGRGQRAGARPGRADHPERANGGGGQTHRAPDLAREGGRRGLAVGARHRDAGAGRAGMEACRNLGQAAARIGVDDHGDPIGRPADIDRVGHQKRRRAARDGIVDEIAAVGSQTGQGGEQEARTDFAGIAGDPGDLDIGSGPGVGRAGAEQLSETHALAPPGSPTPVRDASGARSAAIARRPA